VLYVLDFETRAFIKKIKLSDKSVRTIAINKKLGDLAVGLSDNTIRILDLETFQTQIPDPRA
jgi:WD40 repeat protein